MARYFTTLTAAAFAVASAVLFVPAAAAQPGIDPECRAAFEQGSLAGHECETELHQGRIPQGQGGNQGESPEEELGTICIISVSEPLRAYCHQETEQERQLEKVGKVIDDLICLATIAHDPSCALPWPSPGS